jgi:hypothetical protein
MKTPIYTYTYYYISYIYNKSSRFIAGISSSHEVFVFFKWPAMASHLEWSYRRTLKYSVGRAASPTRRDAAERNAGT